MSRRHSDLFEAEGGLFPEEQCGFRPQRTTTGMTFVVSRLQEPRQAKEVPLHMCFVDLHKANDCVDGAHLWDALALYGIPAPMIAVIRQLHDDM